jgi:hypothetical protein
MIIRAAGSRGSENLTEIWYRHPIGISLNHRQAFYGLSTFTTSYFIGDSADLLPGSQRVGRCGHSSLPRRRDRLVIFEGMTGCLVIVCSRRRQVTVLALVDLLFQPVK